MKPVITLSLGGSLVAPDSLDLKYIKSFVAFIRRHLGKWRFIIVVGGGKICRDYQAVAKKLAPVTSRDLDWIGIKSTRLNAELVRAAFGDRAENSVIVDPNRKFSMTKPVLIAAGYQPGWSTDFVAVMLAKKFGAKKVINLSNIEFVFDKDPKKFKDARPIKTASWKEFRRIVGSRWVPGANKPFDPIASKLAQKYGLEVDIVNGRDLKNLQKVLSNQKFIGTKIL